MAWEDVEVKVSKAHHTVTIKTPRGLAVIHFEDIEGRSEAFPGCLSLEVVTLQGRVEVGQK